MPEENIEELFEPTEKDSDGIKSLRKHAKELAKKLNEAEAKNKELETQTLISKAGFAELKPRQISALKRDIEDVRSEGKQELTPEVIKELAEELGFTVISTQTQTTTQTNNQNGSEEKEEEEVTEPKVEVNDSLQAMSTMEQANHAAQKGQFDPNLIDKMRAAKTPEELRNIVRNEGAASGLAHEWDT